jgi:RNA polymerase sigma factor (sigma-70 family)
VTDPASNDAFWFAEQVQPHEPMLRAWLRARFPEIGEFDDIVQESYTRLLRAHRNGPLENPKAYLFAVARNLAMDHFRRNRTQDANGLAEIDRLAVLDESAGIPEALIHHHDLELLTEAIQMLPARCRQVLTLRKIYGLPQKEIAAQLGIAEHTVEAQVTIGIRKCAEFLRRHRER